MKSHKFDIEIAEKYGVIEAIIMDALYYWITFNKENNKNFHDGFYWVYNSVEAWKKLFPYLSEKQVRSGLISLEKQGAIKTGNYNKSSYDRTKWYCITDKSILPNGQMELTNKENRNDQMVKPIPTTIPTTIPTNYLYVKGEKIFDLKDWFIKNIGLWFDRQPIEKVDDTVNQFLEENVQRKFDDEDHIRFSFQNFLKGKVYKKEKSSGKKEKGKVWRNEVDELLNKQKDEE